MSRPAIELRCDQHLHAKLRDGVVELKCHHCTKVLSRPVFHQFDAVTGDRLDASLCDEIAARKVERLPKKAA